MDFTYLTHHFSGWPTGGLVAEPTNLPFQIWEFQAMTQAQLTTRILAKGPSATLK